MDSLFEIELKLAAKGSRQTSQTLYHQLKAAILDGRLKSGAKLPATRRAGDFFGVSRNTVAEVYEKLLHEGYVATRRGAGTFVAGTAIPTQGLLRRGSSNYTLNEFWLRPDITAAMDFWQDQPGQTDSRTMAGQVDFRPNLIDSRLFPFEIFRKASAKQLRGLEKKGAHFRSPQGNQGNYFLREAITRHIALTRAVVCGADDIVVTSGAQQAFDLLARSLITPNQTVVAIEDPGYPPMRVAFAAAGAKLVPVPVDGEGLIVERLPPDVGVICVCPSHQFPVGVTMSPRRRKALIEFARSRGAVIVEDDYDGEFRYDGSPLEAGYVARPRHPDPRRLVEHNGGRAPFSGRIFRRWRQELGTGLCRGPDTGKALRHAARRPMVVELSGQPAGLRLSGIRGRLRAAVAGRRLVDRSHAGQHRRQRAGRPWAGRGLFL